MRYTLLYAGTPLGTVELPAEPLSAGWLQPLRAYGEIEPVFREACDGLIATNFRTSTKPLVPLLQRAAQCEAELSLLSEHGGSVEPVPIQIWDDSVNRQPPFVLVHFGKAIASDRKHPRPKTDQDGAAEIGG
jgi:hypothetical protein